MSRGVAQPGSAPALGAGGRAFKSPRPDHSFQIDAGPFLAGLKTSVDEIEAEVFLRVSTRTHGIQSSGGYPQLEALHTLSNIRYISVRSSARLSRVRRGRYQRPFRARVGEGLVLKPRNRVRSVRTTATAIDFGSAARLRLLVLTLAPSSTGAVTWVLALA